MLSDDGLAKATVTKQTKRVLKIIAAKDEKFEYEVIEKLFREKYPEYYKE